VDFDIFKNRSLFIVSKVPEKEKYVKDSQKYGKVLVIGRKQDIAASVLFLFYPDF
jgi:hypothetical protein